MTLIGIIKAHQEGSIANISLYKDDIAAFAKANDEYNQAKETYSHLSKILANDKQALAKRPMKYEEEWNDMMRKLNVLTDLAEKQYGGNL